MTPSTVDRQLLRIYVSDHVAGAAGARARVEHMARTYRSTPLGKPLSELATELAEERAVLLEVADRLDLTLSRWKSLATATGERVGRLKLNGRLTSASPLSALLELEVLRGGVCGKRGIWESLASWSDALGLERQRFVDLDTQAVEQIDMLTRLAVVARERVAAGTPDVSGT